MSSLFFIIFTFNVIRKLAKGCFIFKVGPWKISLGGRRLVQWLGVSFCMSLRFLRRWHQWLKPARSSCRSLPEVDSIINLSPSVPTLQTLLGMGIVGRQSLPLKLCSYWQPNKHLIQNYNRLGVCTAGHLFLKALF